MYRKLLYIFIVLIFSLFGIKALFHPGLFTGHDIWHQVVRFYYYSQAINDGQFPPYWVGQLANRFGYPLYTFSYQFPWMIGVILLKLGFDIFSVIRGLFIISYATSGIAMFILVNSLLKDKLAALLSSILFLWAPYHFLIIYVGTSLGTAFIFTFLPLILLGIHLTYEKSNWGIIVTAISLSGIILSQVMNLAFLFPVISIFTIWKFNISSQKTLFIRNISFGIMLGILISAFYLLPAIFYKQDTRFYTEHGIGKIFERNFINFSQLIYSKWGFSPIINNAKNGEISFQLGFAQWISVIFLFILLFLKKIPKAHRTLSATFLLGFITSIFFTQDLSKPIWEVIVNFAAIDFPFRFILPAVFVASICAAIISVNLKQPMKNIFFVLLVAITIYTNRNYINVNQYTDYPISTYLNSELEITTNTYHEYLPLKANSKLFNKPWNEIIGNNLSSIGVKQTTNLLSFNVTVPNAQTVSVGQFYFPGQTLYIDGQISKFEIDQEGRISFILQKGTHFLEVKYQETNLIKIAKTLSLIGMLTLIFIILWHKMLYFYHKK